MAEFGIAALLGGLLRISPAIALAAVGDCLTQRCGRFNLGLEGLVPCGAVAAMAATQASGSPWVGLAAAMLVGMLLGLAFNSCCMLPKVDDLAVGIAFLIGGTALAQFAGSPLVKVQTIPLPSYDAGWLLGDAAGRGTLQIPVLLPAAALLALGLWWLFKSTRAGLLVTAAGSAGGETGLKAAGARLDGIRALATAAGGACGGMSGASLALFYPGGWSDHLATGVGITALTLAFIAGSHPLRTLLAALVFAALAALGPALQVAFGTSGYHILNAIPYLAMLAVLVWTGARLPGSSAAR